MKLFINDISQRLGQNIRSYTCEQIKLESSVISFTDENSVQRVAKIKHNSTNTYEYDVYRNISLKHTRAIPVEDHFSKNNTVYTIYPYKQSELVNWSNNHVVQNFVTNLAELMYSFHCVDVDTFQSKLENTKSQLRDKSEKQFVKLEQSTKQLLSEADELDTYEEKLSDVCSEIQNRINPTTDLMLTHGDIYLPNLIQDSDGDIRYIIDLESTCYGYIVYDIGKAFSRVFRLHSPLVNASLEELIDMYYESYIGELSERQKDLIRLNEVLYSIREYARSKSRGVVYEPWPSYESTGDGIKRNREMAKNSTKWFYKNYL